MPSASKNGELVHQIRRAAFYDGFVDDADGFEGGAGLHWE